jgi:hypothetical protein
METLTEPRCLLGPQGLAANAGWLEHKFFSAQLHGWLKGRCVIR